MGLVKVAKMFLLIFSIFVILICCSPTRCAVLSSLGLEGSGCVNS